MSDDVALNIVDQRHVPHVEELTEVIQQTTASVGHATHTALNDVT